MFVRYSAKGAISEEPASMPRQPAKRMAILPFDENDALVLAAVQRFLDAAPLPALKPILQVRVTQSTIGEANISAEHNEWGPSISVSLHHQYRWDEWHRRIFDPAIFVLMQLLTVSGAWTTLVGVKHDRYYYPAIHWAPGKTKSFAKLARIICNVPALGGQIRSKHPKDEGHYRDFRARTLREGARSEVREEGLDIHGDAKPYSGRDELLQHLPDLFDARVMASGGSTAAIGGMTTQGYMALVHSALEMADRLDATLRWACGDDVNTPREHQRQWVP
jgi:hypothetical protein